MNMKKCPILRLIFSGLMLIGLGLSYGSSGEVLASEKQVSAMPSLSQFDQGSLRKADETVTMSDLFDYKTAQTEGCGTALSKVTARE
jgi:hypothetical protein